MKKQKLDIIHEDDDVIIVNKPPGLLTIPDRFRASLPHARGILEESREKVFVVHRLDKDTSGVICFAKNAAAHKHLSLQFEHHTILKKYLAVVSGRVEKDDIDIDIPLMPNPARPGTMMPSARGKESFTHLHVMERYRIATLVECTLKTGRQHQLRVHCATVGYPLVIDELYGNATEFFVSTVKRRYNISKKDRFNEEKPIITRASLHAAVLGFTHPRTGQHVQFSAEPPKDFSALVNVLRKYSAIPDVLSLDAYLG
ncbi:MAG: RluA family pseudouridine synthase [Candidatus Kapabacteria bacterium]|nr:RluA family pseudouridine synthase [Candidatus Kapabacteria bacterium]